MAYKRDGKAVYLYAPVGMDAFTEFREACPPGTLVVKVQPPGCPRNGTMGHAYVAEADTGRFLGLRLVNSLVRTNERREVVPNTV